MREHTVVILVRAHSGITSACVFITNFKNNFHYKIIGYVLSVFRKLGVL